MLAMILSQMMGGYDDGNWHNGSSGWAIAMMIVVGLVVVGLVITVIVLVTRSGRSHPSAAGATLSHAPNAPGSPTARDILDHRYAAGEIDTTEYEERKRVLG